MAFRSQSPAIPELPAAWRKLTSAAIRESGINYFLDDTVTALEPENGHEGLCFTVEGSTPYRVELDVEHPEESTCTCPHAETVYVCKHMVAAYLTWKSTQTPADTNASTGTPARKLSPRLQEMQADMDFLQAQSLQALHTWITEQCDRSPEFALQLRLWRQTEQAKHTPMTPAQWRSFLTKAMPQRQGLYGRELSRWAEHAMQALQTWEDLLATQADSIRTACTMALRRLYKLWETADDSYGQLYDLHVWLQDMLMRSVQATPPPANWLKDWLKLLEEDPLGNWDEEAFLRHAGTPLQQAYCRHAVAQWEAWCKASPPAPAHSRHKVFNPDAWERSRKRYLLRKRYLWAMEQSMDVSALIALMQQTAQTDDEWLDAYRFCERQQRHREAMTMAQLGVQHHPSSFALRQALLACYMRDGWDQEALALSEQLALERSHEGPQLALYLQCAVACGHTRLSARNALIEKMWEQASPSPYKNMGDAIRWLLRDNDWKYALTIMQRPSASCETETLCQLAVRLPATHAAQAVGILQPLFDREMQKASSPYAQALRLVQLVVQRMPQADAQAWLQSLRLTYKAKRKFMEGLQAITLPAD